jgi:lambda family phage minor tail protein L
MRETFLTGMPPRTQRRKSGSFFIDTKSLETDETVEFALDSPMGLQGKMIPTRQYHSICTWCIRNKYRSGDGCDYAGTRISTRITNRLMIHRRTSATERSLPANCGMVKITSCRLAGSRARR